MVKRIEPLLEAVKSAGIVDVVNCVKSKEFKKKRMEDGEKSWKKTKMYGQFLRELEETDVDLKKYIKKGRNSNNSNNDNWLEVQQSTVKIKLDKRVEECFQGL